MKKTLIYLLLVLFTTVFGACNDPVFYMISEEIAVLKPYISGSPANFIQLNDDMYVASGNNLYKYSDAGSGYSWSKSVPYPHKIFQIASVDIAGTDKIYALFITENRNSDYIQEIDFNSPGMPLGDNIIEDVSGIQAIYAANGTLFINTMNSDGSRYDLYYSTNGTNSVPIGEDVGKLNGIAFNGANYFLSTLKNIYTIPAALDTPTPVPDSDKGFVGMITLTDGTTIAAITGSGDLYEISPSLIQRGSFPGRMASGALAVVNENGTHKLLAGRKDLPPSTSTGHSYGYLELELDENGLFTGAVEDFIEPTYYIGNFPSSIGRNPVNHITQGPCGTIFASTQQNGVWSLRERRNVLSWNSEQ